MHQISNQIVKWQLQALKERGVDLSPIYQSVGINGSKLISEGRSLTAEQFAKLMRATFELVDDEAAGYTQKPLRVGTFRMMCHATIGCDNLRAATLRMINYFSLLSDEFNWELTEQGEEAILTINNAPNEFIHNGFFTASIMTILWRWASWMIDTPILLNRVHFKFSEQLIDEDLTGIYRSSVYFGQPSNQLIIPRHYLDLTIKQNNESLLPFLAHSPECLLSNYQSENSLSIQVKQHLESVEELDSATVDSVADSFQLTGQTFTRRLRKEGHQFIEIKDKVRKSRAVNLLLRSDLTISEISIKLGFSEDSVFYRNFKKWTGVTPSVYRQKNRNC
jgi:AraC-like DNA-binding protein